MFAVDAYSKMLKRNFYVDNLAKTSNCIVDLSKVYSEANVRMKNGNFELESWNSNCPELKVQGGNFVKHDSVKCLLVRRVDQL